MTEELPASWDPIWEDVMAAQSWGKYPPEELVRFIARNFYSTPKRSNISILDMGCGGGACVWYLAREGFSVTGIDGSVSALRQARALLDRDDLSAKLIAGDLINAVALIGETNFDAIINISSFQHNKPKDIGTLIDLVYSLLVPGGKFFSVDLAADTDCYGGGREIEPRTFVDINSGPLKSKGLVHFFTRLELETFFQRFEDVEINYSLRSYDNSKTIYKSWISSGTKPKALNGW